MAEVWKAIPGYEKLYEVSNFGNVRSLYRYKKVLKPSPVNGYLTVELWKDKKRKRIGVHRLVAMCFCENPHNKPFVNHLDETRDNNHADNLEWVTHIENCNYGTAIQRRTQHLNYATRRKNNANQIKKASKPIKQLSTSGELIKVWSSMTECAHALGMSPSGVSSSKRRRGTTRSGYRFEEVD